MPRSGQPVGFLQHRHAGAVEVAYLAKIQTHPARLAGKPGLEPLEHGRRGVVIQPAADGHPRLSTLLVALHLSVQWFGHRPISIMPGEERSKDLALVRTGTVFLQRERQPRFSPLLEKAPELFHGLLQRPHHPSGGRQAAQE